MSETALAPPMQFDPMRLLDIMANRGASAEEMTVISSLAEKWLDRSAEERYGAAIKKFKTLCPRITKTKQADRYTFAAYEDIKKITGPIEDACDITTTFTSDYDHEKRTVQITMRIRVGSFYEDKVFTVRIPAEIKVSNTQQDGAAISYAKRYAYVNGLDIVITGEDNENSLNAVSDEQAKTIKGMVEAMPESDRIKFFAWVGVPTVEDIPQSRFAEVVDVLKRRAAKAKGGAQ